jgi:hypothetical protein
MKTALNTDRRTFLISYLWKSTNNIFIFQEGNDLVTILKNNEAKEIEFIKIYDPLRCGFKRISRRDFMDFFKFETEAHLTLKNNSFFNKQKHKTI